jgi:hypothetical protein
MKERFIFMVSNQSSAALLQKHPPQKKEYFLVGLEEGALGLSFSIGTGATGAGAFFKK